MFSLTRTIHFGQAAGYWMVLFLYTMLLASNDFYRKTQLLLEGKTATNLRWVLRMKIQRLVPSSMPLIPRVSRVVRPAARQSRLWPACARYPLGPTLAALFASLLLFAESSV